MPRLIFIDNLRWCMILLVLSMHAAVTYSGEGGWYYIEQRELTKPVLLFFITYQSFLQSFFMPLLFFLAGYFVPGACDVKGPVKFLKARAFRLGWPILLYVFIIGPLTEYFVSHSWHPNPDDRFFAREYLYYLIRFRFPGGTGPLWFCEALLIFCLVYIGCRQLFVVRFRKPSFCRFTVVLSFAIFLIRIPFPKGSSFFNLQLSYFGAYILFFIAGISAYRNDWLFAISNITRKKAGWIAFVAVILFAPLLLLNDREGGFHWQSLCLSFWEASVGVSMSLFLIILFREKYNNRNALTKFFSDNAFAVYVFHPPILIGIAIFMGSWAVHPLIKFILLTFFSGIASFIIVAQIRKLPALKKIL